MKYLFPILAGKALKSKDPEISLQTKFKALGIVYNLLICSLEGYVDRISGKFSEKNGKNLIKVFELRGLIAKKLSEIESSKLLILQAMDIEIDDSEMVEVVMNQKRMENGFMELLYIDSILVILAENNTQVSILSLKIAYFAYLRLFLRFSNTNS